MKYLSTIVFLFLFFCPAILRGYQSQSLKTKIDSTEIKEERKYLNERRRIYFQGDLPWLKTKKGYKLIDQGAMFEAKLFVDSCLQWATKSNSLADKIDAYALSSVFYESNEDYDNALFYKKKEAFSRDTLLSLNNFDVIQRIRQEFDTEKKELQITQQQIVIDHQKEVWSNLIVLMLLLVAATVYLFYLARQSRIAKERIALLLKELNHRVKNNLQTVSSIMRLQARQVKDPSVREVLQESQARLDALSLIHQQLYRTDDVRNVDLEKFIHDLIDKLLFAHDLMDKPFERNISIESKNLDVDVALPLGLIINELLTNSCKYAYPSVSEAKLTIRLEKKKFYYADNGAGLPENFIPESTATFGTQLIVSLSKQLRGKLRFFNSEGAHCEITLP